MESPFSIQLVIPDEQLERLATAAARRVAEGPPTGSPWMTVGEAAEFLRCPKSYIYDARANGTLTAYRRGRRAILSRAEVEGHAESASTVTGAERA